MKYAKYLSLLCIAVLAVTFGFSSAAAVTGQSTTQTTVQTTAQATTQSRENARRPLTDEPAPGPDTGRAQMEAAEKKWNSLTRAQKEELYALKEKALAIYEQMIDKYLSCGVMDEAAAKEWKNMIMQYKNDMRKTGRMPFFGIRQNSCRECPR